MTDLSNNLQKSSLTDLTFYRGRVALYAILNALMVGANDEVAIQAFTCDAVPEAVMASGAHPVYVDIEPQGFNMDPEDLIRKLNSKTRAVVIQHTYGIPASMDQLLAVANEKGVPIIEDCAHTFVSTYKDQEVGSFGIASFYSYEWGKPIVAGLGGSLKVNDQDLMEKIVKQYAHFRSPSKISELRLQLQYLAFSILFRPILYWPVRSLFHYLGSLGIAESNYNPVQEGNIADDFSLKMPRPLQSRMARKFKSLEAISDHSRKVVEHYQSEIKSDQIRQPQNSADVKAVYARYPLLVPNKAAVLENARQNNVELADWYNTPIHPLKKEELALVHYELGSCPQAEERCSQVVTLPTHPAVSSNDVRRAIRFLNRL